MAHMEHDQDEAVDRLGSTVFWTRMTQSLRVPVLCGMCKRERLIARNTAYSVCLGRHSALCRACSTRRQDDEICPGGSVIHWSDRLPGDRRKAAVTCGVCGNTRYIIPSTQRRVSHLYCLACSHLRCGASGSANGQWRGGYLHARSGYVYVHKSNLVPEEQRAFAGMIDVSNYIAEHRLAMARRLGRPLDSKEVVHHLNGVKDDNKPENLYLTSSSGHNRDAIAQLNAEILRLQALLAEHGIPLSQVP